MAEEDDFPDVTLGPKSVGCTWYNHNGFGLHCRYWRPVNLDVKALVFLSHGFSEHLGFYETLGRYFSSMNILAFGHDHMGHGLSDGARAYASCMDDLADDIIEHSHSVRADHPEKPLFLVGHSMGGMVALRAVLRNKSPGYTHPFSGIVLQSPLIIPGPSDSFFPSADLRITPSRAHFLLPILERLDAYLPTFTLGSRILSRITSDREMQELIRRDELCWAKGIKFRTLHAFIDCMEKNLAEMHELNTPFLVLQGDKDQLCNVKGARLLHDLAVQVPTEDKALRIMAGAEHQLYLERRAVRNQAVVETATFVDKLIDKLNPN